MDPEHSNEGNSIINNTVVDSADHFNPSSSEDPKASDLTIVPKTYEEEADDEDMSQEFQDLIATLPMRSEIGLCQYQGFWFPNLLIQGVLKCQNHFQACDSDILLVTSPKSGTTWLKALIFALINRNNTHKPSPILTTNPHVLVPFLEVLLLQHGNTLNPSSFPMAASSLLSRIYSTHIPYVLLPESVKRSRCKIVYLCRNPKDVFVSLWHFVRKATPETQEIRSLEDSFEDFCQGMSIFGPCWEHMLGYYKESLEKPWKILLLKFEDLKIDPVRTLKELADFLGHGFSQEEENVDVVGNILKLCSFENLSNLEINKSGSSHFGIENKIFFRRGEVGDWKNFLTNDMVERLNAITQEKLEKQGLKF